MGIFGERSRPAEYQRFVRPTPSWFSDAKLGIFLHWGVYSVPAWAEPIGETSAENHSFKHNPYAEWYANTIRIDGSPAQEHHRRVYGPDVNYWSLLDSWRAERFDPAAFAESVAQTGARYFVPVAKHHDGVALWPAPGSEGANTVERGPKRDLIGELARSIRRQGLKFGAYYSGGLDWRVADTGPICEERGDGPLALPSRPVDAAYARFAHAQVKDLIERYRPDVLWGDIDWPDAGKAPGPFSLADLFDRFYESAPEGVVNDRWGDTHWDFRTTEYQMGSPFKDEPWEHNRGIGYSFGYNQMEGADASLTGSACVRTLVDVVASGGNLLLNVGLKADGSLPQAQRRCLEFLGRWNRRYGQAVFSTRPVPTSLARPSDQGDALGQAWVRWTGAADRLYAISDAAGRVTLAIDPAAVAPQSARTIDGHRLRAEVAGRGIAVDLPPADPDSKTAGPEPRVVVFDRRRPI
ncbi:MAG: alpha-L-fucosidase [Bifidobacteriaceae bacterium]|jgi:alpha-L-fucosidase|nr:alpha-L-fucosidase [Bifidobacteriaceae bacterium]